MSTPLSPLREALLHSVLSQPSAPFRERHVLELLQRELEDGNVPHFIDPIGNLVLGVSSKADYLKLIKTKTQEPIRLFIAHTDHPGFHGESWIGEPKPSGEAKLQITWHGGSPIADIEGAKVWLASKEGPAGEGRFDTAKLIPSGRALESGVITVPGELRSRFPKATDLYGGFGFRAPVWQEGRILYTKAADDLVGSFAIVSLALDLYRKKPRGKRPPFLALLTRAEEVGFIGTIGHFELGWYKQAKRPIFCVSLETSRTLPGAEIGKGPVVRLGDKTGVFSSNYLRVFTEIAMKHLPGRHQKRVMDGGTCEATAAIAYGVPSVGISVPLGNYHNMNFEGGPDASSQSLGPAPEFVHMDDIQGLLELCHALLDTQVKWNDPWGAKLKEFRKELKQYGKLLKTGP